MMNQTLSVRRSIFADDGLAALVQRAYDLPQPVTCRLWQQGDNDTYQVIADGVPYVLRAYTLGRRTRGEVAAEAQLLTELAEGGLPVTQPIKTRAGEYIVDLHAPEGLRYGVLFAHVGGTPPGYDITPEQGAVYGNVIAKVHTYLDQVPPTLDRLPIDLDFLLDEPLALIAPFLQHRPADLQFMTDTAAQLRAAIADLPTTAPEYGLCHGDLHKTNLLIDDQGRLTVMDWDCAGYGWRAYDVAVLRWSIGPAVGPTGIGEPRMSQVWERYLESYLACRSLSVDELRAIPYFVGIRHFRVMGWNVRNAISGPWGMTLLNDGHFDYQIGSLKSWLETL